MCRSMSQCTNQMTPFSGSVFYSWMYLDARQCSSHTSSFVSVSESLGEWTSVSAENVLGYVRNLYKTGKLS